MNFFKHKDCNTELAKPKDWDDSKGVKCETLPIFAAKIENTEYIVLRSFWKPTEEEIMMLAQGGCIALDVYSNSHPPVSLEVVHA